MKRLLLTSLILGTLTGVNESDASNPDGAGTTEQLLIEARALRETLQRIHPQAALGAGAAHDLMGLKNLGGYVMLLEFNAVTRITLPFVSQSNINTASSTCSALEEKRHG